MGTEQSSQNAEFTDNDNPSKIINMRYKEIIGKISTKKKFIKYFKINAIKHFNFF